MHKAITKQFRTPLKLAGLPNSYVLLTSYQDYQTVSYSSQVIRIAKQFRTPRKLSGLPNSFVHLTCYQEIVKYSGSYQATIKISLTFMEVLS